LHVFGRPVSARMAPIIIIGMSLFAGSVQARATTAQDDGGFVQTCTLPSGWEDVTERHPGAVIFGASEGLVEPVRFVGSIACALAKSGKHVLVGLDLSSTSEESLQKAWAKPQAQFPAALAFGAFDGNRDGSATQALFDMIVALHAFKDAGLRISITATGAGGDDFARFQESGLKGSNWIEAAQAEHIEKAVTATKPDIALILTQTFHAARKPVLSWGLQIEPMALRLSTKLAVVSLKLAHLGGTAWDCRPKPGLSPGKDGSIAHESVECSAHDLVANSAPEAARNAPYIAMSTEGGLDRTGEDGVFQLSRVTASRPADSL